MISAYSKIWVALSDPRETKHISNFINLYIIKIKFNISSSEVQEIHFISGFAQCEDL